MGTAAVNEAIKKLTEERERLENECKQIDAAIDALRPLAPQAVPPLPNGSDDAMKNGHTIEPTGQLAAVVNMLRSKDKPLTAKAAHMALGRRAPSNVTRTNHLLRKAVEHGLARRTQNEEGRNIFTIA